jgi:hypothetical protein
MCCICDYTSGQTWDECAHPENQLTGYAARLRRSGRRTWRTRGMCDSLRMWRVVWSTTRQDAGSLRVLPDKFRRVSGGRVVEDA